MDKKVGSGGDDDEVKSHSRRTSVLNENYFSEEEEKEGDNNEVSRNGSISEAKVSNEDDMQEKSEGAPTLKSLQALSGGYNQVYIIEKQCTHNKENTRQVFFKCGQWCYKGDIEFFNMNIGVAELPVLIPALQRQQGRLKYTCPSKAVPSTSIYAEPLQFIEDAINFISSEIVSDKVEKELKRWSSIFRWIEEETAKTYFELLVDPPISVTDNVELIATKTYNRGLILVSVFYQTSIYFVLQDGEGDQPLLDVSFPNVSRHGQGLLIANYIDSTGPWKKMTLW
jgi:hypothetical protein